MESAALIVAVIALVISIAAFVYELVSRRRQLMLTIYEKLLEGEQQRGRRLVHELAETGQAFDDLDQPSRDCVNHALSMLNVLGFLYARRYVSRRDAMTLWGSATSRVCRSAENAGFLAFRDAQEDGRVWPYFRDFSAIAEARRAKQAHH
jgi:hypothetical protein